MSDGEKTFDKLAIGHLLAGERELNVLRDAEFDKVSKISGEILKEMIKIQDQILEYYRRQGQW
jgi:hypothetical protein